MENRNVYEAHRLPHWDFGDLLQTITYRLADSLAPAVYQNILEMTALQKLEDQDSCKRQLVEKWLDNNRYGCCLLSHPLAAQIVIDAWRFYHGKRYDLLHWVVMSNHVHVLICLYNNNQIGDVVSAWKGYTSKAISKKIPSTPNPLWQRGFWDRMIRDEKHYIQSRDYILNNPEKAGIRDWPYVSSRYS